MPIRNDPSLRQMPAFDPVAEDIRDLLHKAGVDENQDLMLDLIGAAIKMARDKAPRGDLKIVASAIKELRYAFRVFSSYSKSPKVSVFGSARTPTTDPAYATAVNFCKLISDRGWMVITGAGGGIMEAGHGGAGKEKSFGVAIRLPFETANSLIERDPKLVNFKYFFTRKLMFVKEAEAVCLLPGGYGTHDEGFEVLTLVQTGKAAPMPIVMLDAPGGGFWKGCDDYIREHLLGNKLISPEDLALYHLTDSVEDAVGHILRFYRRYHSSRFVGDDLVMRLNSPLPAGALEKLNAEFADLLKTGVIRTSEPLSDETNEDPAVLAKPRLLFTFNRRKCGRLRQFIDRVNEFE